MFAGRLLIFNAVKRRSSNHKILTNHKWKSTSSHEIPDTKQNERNERNEKEMIDEAALPPEPTYCCNTGCANCVWIKYAQELAQLFDNGDEIAKKKISEKVHDPNLRAYLFKQLDLQDDEKK